jgi:YidC/Oxa1 family membrane protein insertase
MNGPDNNIDQRNLVLAIVLSVLVLMVWQSMMPAPVKTMPNQKAQTDPLQAGKASTGQPASTTTGQSKTTTPNKTALDVAIKHRPLAQLLNEGVHGIEISNVDGQISQWTLYEEQYRTRLAEPEGSTTPFRFVHRQEGDITSSMFLPPIINLSLDGAFSRGDYTLRAGNSGTTAIVEWTDAARNVQIRKTYTLNTGSYTVDVKIELINRSAVPVSFGVQTKFGAFQNDAEAKPSMFMPPLNLYNFLCARVEDFERLPGSEVRDHIGDKEPHLNSFSDGIRWAGVDNRYFMTAMMVAEKEISSCSASVNPGGTAGIPIGYTRLFNTVELVGGTVKPGATVSRQVSFYGGPKKLSELKNQSPTLGEAIDFGMFSVICVPMLWLMRFFFEYIPNWGIAIILLTLLVKLLTLPLTVKQYKSMAAMKKVQPLMKALQDKYGEDKVRLQQEMMKLYREHQVNPLAGCLPMIMMMPIYFALYRTIYSAVELYQANFGFWIADLSKQDPYYITPVILGLLMIVQFRLNPSAGDQMQAKIMMWVMPIMFTAMMLFLPSGLVVYILVNTVLGIMQQWYFYRAQGITSLKA